MNKLFEIQDEKPIILEAKDALDYQYRGGKIEFKGVHF